jgi:tetratricopeptide (TPR) repeat protein
MDIKDDEGAVSKYGVVLPGGEVISGTAEEYPVRLVEWLHRETVDKEKADIIHLLLEFYMEAARHRLAGENWPDLLGTIADLALRAHTAMAVGCHMEKVGDFAKATEVYRTVILMEPIDRKVWYYAHNNLGFCLNQLGDFIGGEEFCREALRINPVLPNAHKNLGLALQGQGRWAEAARAFITGTLTYPADGRSLRHLLALVEAHPAVHEQMPTLDDDIARCAAAVESADR